jgi:transcription-repair coupling factor (superfamily II helicase)
MVQVIAHRLPIPLPAPFGENGAMEPSDRAALQDLLRLLDVPAKALEGPEPRLRWTSPTALALLLAQWSSEGGRLRPLWVDAPTEGEAEILARELTVLLPQAGVAHFPGMAPYAGGESSPPGMVQKARLSTLVGLLERRVQVLVTGPLAARERLPHPTWFQKRRLELRRGAEVPRDLLLETLVELGYRRTELASEPGEFSARGHVVDLWPDHLENPLRLEFFGDELELLAPFDPDSQRRSGDTLEGLTLYPRHEADRHPEALLRALESRADRTLEPGEDLAFRRQRLAIHGHFPGEELFHPLLDHAAAQLAHWVAPCFRLRLDPPWAAGLADQELTRIGEGLTVLRRGGVVCPDPGDRFLETDPSRPSAWLTEWQADATVSLQAQPPREFQGRLAELAEYLQELALTGHRIFLAGSTPGMRDRLSEILRQYELPFGHGTQPGCRVLHLSLQGGAFLKEPKVLVLTEREVFGRRALPSGPKKSRTAAFLSDLRDLKVGDRMVHLDHGIGEFLGFGVLTVGGEDLEVVQLRYADGGLLNVNLERADLLQRFVAPDGTLPPLDKLGGQTWTKVKRRAKRAIQDMAEELLKIYARRRLEKGHAYPADGPDMAAFDATFPFEPTPDQVEAIAAVKADLESERPMDRLLVGDVGFGKTEVGMRACAKVALEGRQVVVLCPTTILCFQHFRTFKERFAGFPVRIEMLNRFVDPADQKRILEDVERGRVEILIGTHQVLGAKVRWSDLGLVVIDEEQRFGVVHKERLKKLRANLDVLAMSATPIPRTLHMSLTGLREISLIETPPKNRLAIETVVAPWSDELVSTAIRFELRRAGQVYLVHNRVESILSMADRIRELVPEARLAVAHGQMQEHQLERAMVGFMDGSVDVLLATTIVENGLDVPNANTLIVHRADAFGLSQLYQLRGRVGRSDVPAYAYLLIPGRGEISEDARRRLQALEDFSELGSGFRVAAMDLEIRGAGNLLGGEQSGHIHEIGFELYIKLLEETLAELQGQPTGAFEVKVELGVGPVQLSRRWIDQAAERLVAYKRATRLRTERDLDLYRLELEDRFGQVPAEDSESARFFEVLRVRILALALAVGEVSLDRSRLRLRVSPQTSLDPARLLEWVRARKEAQLSPDGSVLLPLQGTDAATQALRVLREWGELGR